MVRQPDLEDLADHLGIAEHVVNFLNHLRAQLGKVMLGEEGQFHSMLWPLRYELVFINCLENIFIDVRKPVTLALRPLNSVILLLGSGRT